MAFETQTVEVAGHGFSPRIFRGGSGQPLVFLHAAGGVGPNDPVIGRLAESFEVIAPVHPGFRDLEEVGDIADVHDLALYYDDLMGVLGLESPIVVGHSFGGMIGAELAAHVPARVGKLVLMAPVGLWRDDAPVADLFAAFPENVQDLLWGDPGAPEAAAYMAAAAQDVEGATGDDPMLAMMLAMVQGLATAAKFMWPIPDKGLRKRLHRVSAPTLVIWGSKDKLVPASYADDFVKAIPDARAEVLEGAGHMVPVERLDDAAKLISDFAG